MIPTAEDVMIPYDLFDNEDKEMIKLAMIEFAKIHCEAQAKTIAEKATTEYIEPDGCATGDYYDVNKESILNAYPLTNIK